MLPNAFDCADNPLIAVFIAPNKDIEWLLRRLLWRFARTLLRMNRASRQAGGFHMHHCTWCRNLRRPGTTGPAIPAERHLAEAPGAQIAHCRLLARRLLNTGIEERS
jgi:hypothetical protein